MQRDSPLRALCFPTPTDTGPTPLSSGQLPRHTQPGWRAVGPAPGGNSAHHAVFGCVLPQRLSGVHPPHPLSLVPGQGGSCLLLGQLAPASELASLSLCGSLLTHPLFLHSAARMTFLNPQPIMWCSCVHLQKAPLAPKSAQLPTLRGALLSCANPVDLDLDSIHLALDLKLCVLNRFLGGCPCCWSVHDPLKSKELGDPCLDL